MKPLRHKIIRILAATGVIVTAVWLSGARLFAFPGESMSPTVRPGDCFVGLVGPWHLRTPARFDLVIYEVPPASKWAERKVPWMKRLIGLPGERVQLSGAALRIDGQPIEAPFLHVDGLGKPRGPIDVQLKADEYFFLGDNLDHSFDDSRTMGPIPRSLVRGFVAGILRTGKEPGPSPPPAPAR